MSTQAIFERLRKAGCTVTGALSLMGNWKEESNLEPCRLQGDFQPDRWPSKEYARKVDNALVSDEWFYLDGKGWGIPQFTFWTRKKGFLEFCRKRSISIANEEANVDYALQELKTESQYSKLWALLSTCEENQLYTAVERVCREFERPAYNNVNVRYQYALDIKKEMQSWATENIDNSLAKYWPPRGAKGGKDDPGLCKGMNGPDVEALQGLLYAHGYTYGSTKGVFGDSTDRAVRKYQTDNNLVSDGIAGPITWAAITKL